MYWSVCAMKVFIVKSTVISFIVCKIPIARLKLFTVAYSIIVYNFYKIIHVLVTMQ